MKAKLPVHSPRQFAVVVRVGKDFIQPIPEPVKGLHVQPPYSLAVKSPGTVAQLIVGEAM